jgi:hypothetical protein
MEVINGGKKRDVGFYNQIKSDRQNVNPALSFH